MAGFQLGNVVKLSRYGLDTLYPSGIRSLRGYRRKASFKRFVIIGYSRDNRCIRVNAIGNKPSSQSTYYMGFLEEVES